MRLDELKNSRQLTIRNFIIFANNGYLEGGSHD